MPKRLIQFQQNGHYHIYNRGANKQPIFFSEQDYRYLLKLCKKYKAKYQISILAYCLMPNHYHFLLRQDAELSASLFIRDTFNAYVQGINKKQERSGSLFQGRFQAVQIDKEDYLVHVCRYIHLNPLKAMLVSSVEDWAYSNYLEWIGVRKGNLFDNTFRDHYFTNPEAYRAFIKASADIEKENRLKPYLFD